MLDENLTPEERGELLKLLRDTIERDRYPLSPRIRSLKAILTKLDPSTVRTESEPQPLPAPGKRVEPSWRMARNRRR